MVNKQVDVSYFFLKTREVLKIDKDSSGKVLASHEMFGVCRVVRY